MTDENDQSDTNIAKRKRENESERNLICKNSYGVWTPSDVSSGRYQNTVMKKIT